MYFDCMHSYVHHMHAWGVGSRGTGVTDTSEPSCGCWILNPGPLEEQPVLLSTEPSLQALILSYTMADFKSKLSVGP